MARSGAQRQSAVAVPPQQTALQQMTQNFAIELSPFPESAQAVAFKARTETLVVRGVTDAESHREALTELREGKRLQRGMTEHWMRVKRWLRARTDDISSIQAMDLALVEPSVAALGAHCLTYETAEKRRIAEEQERQRLENERIAHAQRAKDLADLERKALEAEAVSQTLSARELAFVEEYVVGPGVVTENAPEAARKAGYKDFPTQGFALLRRPKIEAAITARMWALALREQQTAKAAAPVKVKRVEVQSNLAKVSGTRTVTTYTSACFDVDLFIDEFIAYIRREALGQGAISKGFVDVDRQMFRDLMMPNLVGGNAKARTLHENMDRIPGWRHVKSDTKAG